MADDRSVNGFDGTYETGVTPRGRAGPSWVPGPGLVAEFSGSINGNISFPTPLNLGANGYTVEAWINPTLSSLQNTSRILASGRGLNGYGFGTAAGGELVFTSFGVKDYFTTTLTLLPNQWSYVGVVLDASNDANFYVNGALAEIVTGIDPTLAPSLNFSIGSRSPPAADEFFTGGLAGISVYDTALTPTQIQAQYLAATIPEPSSLTLLAFGMVSIAGCIRRRRVR
ncbi:MAG TPA: LamG domain-containing protein [Chthoniobacteraceae bacterium]|nr:LamG domain-containing protein [Chthoniobacteraceae bacterium]